MKLSQLRDTLARRNLQLTKSLGQNFLHDGNQLRRILAAAELAPGDKVLEIGPGLGALTELLLVNAGEVLAIEKDRRLVECLHEQFAAAKNLTLVHDDAMDFLRRERRDWGGWKLVANLPYSVASPILVELAQADDCPSRMVATLQLEVARRIIAGAGDEDYGILSLLLQLPYKPGEMFKIPGECFHPAPDVDSACVTLLKRKSPLLPDASSRAIFTRMVKLGFSQRRKMLLKMLKTEWPEDTLAAAFERANLQPQIRAEKVSLDQFVTLTKFLECNQR